MELNIDPKGVMKIKQEGFYYSVSNNDALILNKYFRKRVFIRIIIMGEF